MAPLCRYIGVVRMDNLRIGEELNNYLSSKKREGVIVATFPLNTQQIIVDYFDRCFALSAQYIPSAVSYLLTYIPAM